MDQLQACYFCGAAEDDPLREVTVTPRSRRDDPEAQVALTLCRSCEQKLERVLDGLFEHVDSDRSAAPDRDAPDAERVSTNASVDQIDVGAEPADEASAESDSESAAPSGTHGDGGAAATDEAAATDTESRVTARATMNSTEGLGGISVEDYNRVMRLLQNRDLPMDRQAFVVLATNAYEMHEDEVEALLDKVIEKGKLAMQDDQLVRPADPGSS